MNPSWGRVFAGTDEHVPMLWFVRQLEDGRWAIDESYDDGQTWICNCHVPTLAAGMQFVNDWFIDNA